MLNAVYQIYRAYIACYGTWCSALDLGVNNIGGSHPWCQSLTLIAKSRLSEASMLCSKRASESRGHSSLGLIAKWKILVLFFDCTIGTTVGGRTTRSSAWTNVSVSEWRARSELKCHYQRPVANISPVPTSLAKDISRGKAEAFRRLPYGTQRKAHDGSERSLGAENWWCRG